MNITLKAKTTAAEADGPQMGIVRLTGKRVTGPQLPAYHWKLIVDVSGSMDDQDGRSSKTRLENVKTTLVKLFEYLYKQSTGRDGPKHVADVVTFSGTGQTHAESFDLSSDDDFERAVLIVQALRSQGMTDISSAISAAADMPTIPNARVCVAMLTDGEVTVGCSEPQALKEQLAAYIKQLNGREGSLGVASALVGYGIDHDSDLLETLASVDNAEYHCVESSEGAGAVYGEIAHGFTFEAHREIRLEINGALLHNGETDEWVTGIDVGRMADQVQRTWLWKADGSGIEVSVHVTSITYQRMNRLGTPEWCFMKLKTTDTNRACIIPDNGVVDREVVVYELRATTQSLLREAREAMRARRSAVPRSRFRFGIHPMAPPVRSVAFPPEQDNEASTPNPPEPPAKRRKGPTLEGRLTEWLAELKAWITQNGEDAIVRTLCDDTYVALRGLRSTNGRNFIVARQTSQARQRSYNPSDLTALDDATPFEIDHSASQDMTSPYAPPSAVALMRAVTQDSGDTR